MAKVVHSHARRADLLIFEDEGHAELASKGAELHRRDIWEVVRHEVLELRQCLRVSSCGGICRRSPRRKRTYTTLVGT